MKLVVVRHGATEWSRLGRHTSTTDLPLLADGVGDAAGLASALARIDFAAVWSSPRLRARQTAGIAGFSHPHIDPDLVEWNYGNDEGRTTFEIEAERPGWDKWRDGYAGDAEPVEAFVSRVDRVIARVVAIDGPVLLFAHGHLLRALGARWVEAPLALAARLALDPGHLCVLSEGTDGLRRRSITTWNHLPQVGRP